MIDKPSQKESQDTFSSYARWGVQSQSIAKETLRGPPRGFKVSSLSLAFSFLTQSATPESTYALASLIPAPSSDAFF